MTVTIKAYANCDRTYVVWHTDARIPGCLGFALERRQDGVEEVLDAWVGFASDPWTAGTHRPTTEWPIQKFMWADFAASVGSTVQYRVTPMTGTPGNLTKATDLASDWSAEVEVTPHADAGLSAYFNRGVVATQWLARRLEARGGQSQSSSLAAIIATPGDLTRNDLSDPLRPAMLDLLSEVSASGGRLYAALFELEDPELLPALCGLGASASVVLSNGSQSGQDENAAGRAALRQAGVTVFDRMLSSGHLGHNKFAVVCDAADTPLKAWTGSTNWTETGLCTQANNGLLIEDGAVAGWFKGHWDALRDAGSDFPGALVEADAQRSGAVGSAALSAWFTPVANLADLDQASALIDGAKQGILFLMFNPGPTGTLFNAIIDRADSTSLTYDPNLYIHGVMNQDPGTTAHPIPAVVFTHRGQQEPAGFDVVLPAAIDPAFASWQQELLKLPTAHAMVHSKTIVIDPFGEHPVLMTGSHNMGPKASGSNDDNLVIVENAPRLAAAYAVAIIGVYNDYRWRFRMAQRQQAQSTPPAPQDPAAPAPPAGPVPPPPAPPVPPPPVSPIPPTPAPSQPWTGLGSTDGWQDDYLDDPSKVGELAFWLGSA